MSDPTSMRVVSAETVSLSTSSAQSSAFGSATTSATLYETIRVVCDAACWLEFGTDPTVVAESAGAVYLPAGTVEYFDIAAGNKVAGILASSTAKLNVARMGKP